MRILFLSEFYRPSRHASANRSLVLVDALQAAGHDVSVLAASDNLNDASGTGEAVPGVAYYDTFPLGNKTLVERLRNSFGSYSESKKAAKTLGKFDVVICATPPLLLTASAASVAKRSKAKIVLDIRDIWPDVAYEMGAFTPGSAYGQFFARLAKKAYRDADFVFAVSPGKVKKLEGRVGTTPVVLSPNGIDETFVIGEDDTALIDRFELKEKPTCVYAGNIGLAQGLDTLLDIAKQRPAVQFLLFGKGAAKKDLQTRASAEGLSNVEFPGTLDEQGVRTVLRHASLAYVPLINSNLRDSIPTKMFEALACGCPVLLAAEGDAADVIDQCGFGAHVAPEDSTALLAKFDELMAKQYSQEEREAASRWVLENYSRQKFAKDFVRAISELSKER